MTDYTLEELTEALRAINSIIHKCEKAREKFPEGNAHHTLLRNRLKALTAELQEKERIGILPWRIARLR